MLDRHWTFQRCVLKNSTWSSGHCISGLEFVNMSPGIDCKESIATMLPAYVAWRFCTSNRVVAPARQAGNRFLGSSQGLQIRIFSTAILTYTTPFLPSARLPLFRFVLFTRPAYLSAFEIWNLGIYWCWWQALLLPHPERGLRPHGPRRLRRALAAAPFEEEATKMILKVVFSFPLPVLKNVVHRKRVKNDLWWKECHVMICK